MGWPFYHLKGDPTGLCCTRHFTGNAKYDEVLIEGKDGMYKYFAGVGLVTSLPIFLLSANIFISQAAKVAEYCRVSSFLTSALHREVGWEELFLIVSAAGHGYGDLALGIAFGGAFSNLLLALPIRLSGRTPVPVSRNHFIAMACLFLTAFVAPLTMVDTSSGTRRLLGILLLVLFAFHSQATALTRSNSSGSFIGTENTQAMSEEETDRATISTSIHHTVDQASGNESAPGESPTALPVTEATASSETTPLLSRRTACRSDSSRKHFLRSCALLVVVFIPLVFASMLLPYSAHWSAYCTCTSDTRLGIVGIALVTTLSRTVMHAHQEAADNTPLGSASSVFAISFNSNIFLLTCCVAIVWLAFASNFDSLDNINIFELFILTIVTLLVAAIAWLPNVPELFVRRLLLVLYICFIVLEITLVRPGFTPEQPPRRDYRTLSTPPPPKTTFYSIGTTPAITTTAS